MLPDAASLPTRSEAQSHAHLSIMRERKKKAKRSRKTNARTTHRAYLCRSRTWKKPRFQPKTQFSWLSLTFSRFARKNVTDVVTTRLRCFASLSPVEERATMFFHTDHEKSGKMEEEGRPKKKRTDESFFSFSLVSSFFFPPLAPKESFWVWGKNNVSSFSHP